MGIEVFCNPPERRPLRQAGRQFNAFSAGKLFFDDRLHARVPFFDHLLKNRSPRIIFQRKLGDRGQYAL